MADDPVDDFTSAPAVLQAKKLWHTDVLLRGVRGGLPRLLVSKTVVLLSALTLLTLPFWLTVAWIARSNLWDGKLLLALLLAQIFIALYAALLSLTISRLAETAAARFITASTHLAAAVALARTDD